jgi:hypothetical protein
VNWAPAAWRDVDFERGSFGIKIWRWGGEVHLGKRLYRLGLAWR